jgi:hypothetical protein
MPKFSKRYALDVTERLGWTLAQAGVAFAVVETQDWQGVYVPIIAAGLSAVKSLVARHIGDSDSAATLPSA